MEVLFKMENSTSLSMFLELEMVANDSNEGVLDQHCFQPAKIVSAAHAMFQRVL